MTLTARLLGAILLLAAATPAVSASPRSTITAMRGQQATEWHRSIVDLNLVDSYYGDPANPPIWIEGNKLAPAAAELLEALTRADEDGLDPDDYLTREILDTDRLATTRTPPVTSWP